MMLASALMNPRITRELLPQPLASRPRQEHLAGVYQKRRSTTAGRGGSQRPGLGRPRPSDRRGVLRRTAGPQRGSEGCRRAAGLDPGGPAAAGAEESSAPLPWATRRGWLAAWPSSGPAGAFTSRWARRPSDGCSTCWASRSTARHRLPRPSAGRSTAPPRPLPPRGDL